MKTPPTLWLITAYIPADVFLVLIQSYNLTLQVTKTLQEGAEKSIVINRGNLKKKILWAKMPQSQARLEGLTSCSRDCMASLQPRLNG